MSVCTSKNYLTDFKFTLYCQAMIVVSKNFFETILSKHTRNMSRIFGE